MKITVLLLILLGLDILYRKRMTKLNSNIGHNLAIKHLEDEFGVNIDEKDKGTS